MNNEKFDNKIILIAGATSGIGRALALMLANKGAKMILLGKNKKALDKLDDEFKSRNLAKPVLVEMDLENIDLYEYKSLAKNVEDNFGKLDILISTIAYVPNTTPITDVSVKEWNKTININFMSHYYMLVSLLNLLSKSDAPRVVFSMCYFDIYHPYITAYNCAKSALSEFTVQFQKEATDNNLCISMVNPGPTNTKLIDKIFHGTNIPKLQTPEEAALQYLPHISKDYKAVEESTYNLAQNAITQVDYQGKELLKDQIILIVGASSDIGKAVAILFAQQGAKLILTARTKTELNNLQDAFKDKKLPDPLLLELDIRDFDKFQSIADTITKKYGKLDAFLSTVGYLGQVMPVSQLPVSEFHDIINVNLNAHYYLFINLIDVLLQSQKRPRVLWTGCTWLKDVPYITAYNCAKDALMTLTNSLQDQFGTKIAAATIDPQPTNTKLRSRIFPDEDKSKLQSPDTAAIQYLYWVHYYGWIGGELV